MLSGWWRVDTTLVGALQRGQRIQRHRSASTVHPVLHLLAAPSEQDANLAFADHPADVRHASHAISATKATIQTAQNRLWRAAARQKYSSLMSCSG